mmetsp:Transcript_11590/g.18736  ORF Transcript_11590/g.18736 Transcript_11590/m.18736 type:complete len:345 (-) Transcript_11590:320-1354(-)
MWSTALIVGAGGCTGRAVLDVLVSEAKASRIILTSRGGQLKDLPETKENVNVEVMPLDMIDGDLEDLTKMCQETKPDVMFCCIGIPKYHVKAWGPGWPKIADRLILACKTTKVPLVFMDNLYAFGPEGMQRMPLLETDTEFVSVDKAGPSTKPQARGLITRKFLAANVADGTQITLVRAADFFGPRVGASVLHLAWADIMKNKTPNLLGNPKKLHAQTYVPDIARALVLVAENPDTWGRAWHVPTIQPDKAMEEWIRDILRINNKPHEGKLHYMALDGILLRFLSFFMEDVDGLRDTMFMWRGDYTVSSKDFEARFPDYKTTPLEEALQATNEWFLAQQQLPTK